MSISEEELDQLIEFGEETLRKKAEEGWGKGDLTYKLTGAQRVIYTDLRNVTNTETYRVMECARGFGKSHLALLMAAEDCLRPPFNYPVFLIAPDLKQCVEIFTPIFRWHTQDAPEGLVKPLRSENKFRVGGNTLIMGGFNRDYVDSLRGQRAKAIYVDEGRDCDPEDFIYGLRDVMANMVSHSRGPINILSSTPGDLNHPFITEMVPEAQSHSNYFMRTIDENETLDQDQKDRLIRNLGGRESERAQRELWCKRIRESVQVICPSFVKARHVALSKRPPKAIAQVFADWGGVRDKTVFQILSFHYDRQKVVTEWELVFEPNTPTKTIIENVLAWERKHLCQDEPIRVIDAPGQVIVDLIDLGYQCAPPRKETFIEHVAHLNTMFVNDQLEISPNCPSTIATLEHGKLNKNRTDFERTQALGHCDAVAALIYGVRHLPLYFPDLLKTPEQLEEERINELSRQQTKRDDFDVERW